MILRYQKPSKPLHLEDNGHFVMQRMYRAVYTPEQPCWKGKVEPYSCLQIEPAAQVLNYGQSVFEGMKAQRTESGQIVLFRPQENAARMAQGTHDPDTFLECCAGQE